jgi:hypothetical protein
MTKLIPFPAHRVTRLAERLLILSASRELLNPPKKWADRPVPPEPLGNLLQRLQLRAPAAVLLLQNVVAEMLALIERQDHTLRW